MKDFVRENWKIAAVCAAGALFLSLLTGLIARNPIGVAIFRALLFAILFGGLGIAGRVLLRRYLPEIAGTGGGEGQAKPAETRGSKVDITVGEDEAPASSRPRPAAKTSPPPGAERPAEAGGAPAAGVEEETVSQLDDAASQAEAQALGDLAEELSEDLPEDGEEVEGGEEGEPEGGEAAADERAERAAAAMEDGDLDSLPDISNLEVASPEPPSSRRTRSESASSTPEDALRSNLSGQDPVTLAKAIRTVLKKDEKG